MREVPMVAPAVTLIELLVDDEEESVETETFWVTPAVYLRVPTDADVDLVSAVIDAICAC